MGYINPTNDPARDWDRYCDMEDEYRESRPVCDHCGEHILDDFYFVLPFGDNGQTILCGDCLDNDYKEFI